MAYKLRYYKEFEQGSIRYRLEIHKKDSTLPAVEIGNVLQGLLLEIQGQQDDIDAPIVKTSLSMTFVDAYDLSDGKKNGVWEEFYTPDALSWNVKLLEWDNEGVWDVVWSGFVTPDSYSENLTYRGSVNIIARDNIGYMQDFPFDAEGDAYGMISLREIVNTAFEKASVDMSVSFSANAKWMTAENGTPAPDTLMNVSAFEGKSWYDALEAALYAYGAVLRFNGWATFKVRPLRWLPHRDYNNIDSVPRIVPKFVAGATRELVPAVKRIEEVADYELVQDAAKAVGLSDFTGTKETYFLMGNSVTKEGVSYPIKNKTSGNGWCNPQYSLFFNPNTITFAYGKDGDKKYTWLAANDNELYSADARYAEYSKYVNPDNLLFNLTFGSPYVGRSDGTYIQYNNVTTCKLFIIAERNGVSLYLNDKGDWVSASTSLVVDASNGISQPINLEAFDGSVLLKVRITNILTTTDAFVGQRFVPVYNAGFSCNKPLRERNSVNTLYNENNNVILSRDPQLAPSFEVIGLPVFIKNGIFERNGDAILPTKTWQIMDGLTSQMSVGVHMALLAYYAKPNNLITGTIVNSGLRFGRLYNWNGVDHMLLSGTYNYLNGHIEGAVLREFATFDSIWGGSSSSGASLPDTEQKSTSNKESGGGASQAATYSLTTNVSLGGGYWSEKDGMIYADRDVYIDGNLIVTGDISAS